MSMKSKLQPHSVRAAFSLPTVLLSTLLVLGIFCVYTPLSHAAIADDLQNIRRGLTRLESKIRLLAKSQSRLGVDGTSSLRQRLSSGKVNFLLKDYLRASIILVGVVQELGRRRSTIWYEAMFYLAESLYLNRNQQGALKYYRQLTAEGRDYSDKALVRLMEIASKTNKYTWLNNYFKKSGRSTSGELQQKIFYFRAKGIYQQAVRAGSEYVANNKGRTLNSRQSQLFIQSKRIFGTISRSSRYWPQAQYFKAVVGLQTANYATRTRSVKDAIQLMEAGYSVVRSRKSSVKIQSTFQIALGRLYLELADYAKALKYYRQIGRKSAIFDQALYEISWTHIRRAQAYQNRIEEAARKNIKLKTKLKPEQEYKRALRALSLLLGFLSQSPFYPKAQLLRGHLLLKLNNFKGALKNYETVVGRYSSVHKEMNRLLKNRSNPKQFFENMISRQLDRFDVSTVLPKAAIQWMTDEVLMNRALLVLRDLQIMNKHLKDSRQIIKKLESALNIPDRISLSPSLKEGQLQATAYKNKITIFQAKLNQLERSIVYPKMSLAERKQYDKMRQKVAGMEAVYDLTAKNMYQYKQRNRILKQRLQALESRVHKQNLRLTYAKRELRAVRRWLINDPRSQKLTPSQRKVLEKSISALEYEYRSIIQYKNLVTSQLEIAKIQMNYSKESGEQKIQNRYSALLQKERLFLAKIKPRLNANELRWVGEIQRIRRQMRGSQKTLRDYFKALGKLMANYSVKMQQRVNAEKVKLDGYEVEILKLQGNAKRLASQIAYNSFLLVRQKFYDLVLKAEVGVIDVVWQEKQANQRQIFKLTKERNNELRLLNSEFKGLLKEVGGN